MDVSYVRGYASCFPPHNNIDMGTDIEVIGPPMLGT